MINITSDLYTDYKKALEILRTLDRTQYQYPDYIVPFHTYTEVKNKRELLAIKSYFATQNLDHTKLILWSDYDIRNNELLKPFSDKIDFRVYDPMELAKGTVLEGDEKQLLAKDESYYLMSGMLRFLVTHKFGGVWFDMDMVLLNDFAPIMDQEFAYSWGYSTDFKIVGPCAALMNFFKGSEFSQICLEELKKMDPSPNSMCRDRKLLAKVYRKKPFTVMPCAFFNTEWQMQLTDASLSIKIHQGWFSENEYSNTLFPEAFSWHWHHRAYRNVPLEKGSKFDLMDQYISKKLVERKVL